MLLPGVMSHTWTLVVFPAWYRQCEDVGFHIMQLCQTLTETRGTNACSFLESGSLLSHLAYVRKKRWGKEDLLISSFSCSKICNNYHWVSVAAVSKQNSPPCHWNVIGVPLCPSSWRHPDGSGSRGKSSLISGDLRQNLNKAKTQLLWWIGFAVTKWGCCITSPEILSDCPSKMDVKRNIDGEAWISKQLAMYFDLFIWELIQWK